MAARPTVLTARQRAAAGRRKRRNVQAPSAQPTPNSKPSGSETFAAKGLYGYIWEISSGSQILLASLSIFIFLLDLVPLELQRRIINDAIGNRVFAELIWLCGIYAVTTLMQGVAKLIWNVYRNSVGEAASRRLRLETFAAALRYPEPDAFSRSAPQVGRYPINVQSRWLAYSALSAPRNYR
jgi:ABC-type multidrug transport system fused ATPase/permease subunit